jgi:quercetin dioxygenase-like cupin family protein
MAGARSPASAPVSCRASDCAPTDESALDRQSYPTTMSDFGYEKTGDEIGANVSVIVVDAAPGDGPALHRHPYAEVFVVLEGEATFTLGDEPRVLHAGEIAVAPAGVPHRFVNSGSGRLRQVDVHEHVRFDTEWL